MASDAIDVTTSDSDHEEGAEDGSSSYQVLESFRTAAEAIIYMDSYSPYRFSVLHGSSRVGGLVTTYSCASNDPCDYTLCLYSQGDQHTVEARGAHTLKSTATEKKGINRSVLAEVESLLSGNGPKGCLIALQQRYQNNQARLCLIPTVAQLKNRKQYLNKQAAGWYYLFAYLNG
ncbi:hypothetical protein L917_21573 [Phytophthora nicotianae]|uniref:Uncharacterized protein n=1 Tax=Phytophthora nicotianae TaxID=4792 RepID=W2JZ68_PHYNI|nr:hypothetical protein L917_21573 [Phytophthora nicotianae]